MPDIVLSTLNAKFIHASFGLRCLFANLGGLQSRAEIVEFEIRQTPLEIAESLLARQPRILGLGIYIWNVRPTLDLVTVLKRLAPEVVVVIGGPEVSHETAGQEIVQFADHTVTGEADLAFAALCRALLEGNGFQVPASGPGSGPLPVSPPPRIIHAPLPDLSQLQLPYDAYTDTDLAHRILYVEASRGCPFTCEFCLSSLDIPVRQFPLEPFLAALQRLLDRGARHFKFVDRTFNLNLHVSRAILRFFRDRWRDGLFVHFEMIPDRLPEALRAEIAWFPPGAIQLEIGIQSFNPEVCARISRKQDPDRTADNFRFLREQTGVHIHADLIAGLPGETLGSFGDGFDRLLALRPQEIQVGILKRLRGTPIIRHDSEWSMRYSPFPPYEILSTRDLDFPTLQRLRRFARYWDLVANSGRFGQTLPLVWPEGTSPFRRFMAFADWLFAEFHQTHAIALDRLAHALFRWLTSAGGVEITRAATALAGDWTHAGFRDLPPWLSLHAPVPPRLPRPVTAPRPQPGSKPPSAPHSRRQARTITLIRPPQSPL